MTDDRRGLVTELLQAAEDGSRRLDEVVPLLYDDLRRIAQARLRREYRIHTLETRELVHEAYVRLVDQTRTDWKDRAHFLAVASTVMRRVLIDYVRRKTADKRSGDLVRITLSDDLEMESGATPAPTDLIVLDAALNELAERSPRLGRVVECRFFGGMSVDETAEALGVSPRTVDRDWIRARTYLSRSLGQPETQEDP